MPRAATYKIGALNITIHPHSAARYAELFKDAFKIRRPIKIHGTTQGVVHMMFDYVEGHPEKGIQGNLIKYTEINPKDPWYDVQKGKQATQEQLDDLSIPEGLAPNMKWTRYFFDPVHHKFIWVCMGPNISFSPHSVWVMLTDFLGRNEIIQKYGNVGVTIEQDRDRLEKIFKLYRIDRLSIIYDRPNPDDDDDDAAERAVEKKLKDQRIQKVETVFVAERNESIVPDKTTLALSRLAVSNGKVVAKGLDAEGKKITENTEEHPWIDTYKEQAEKMSLAVWLPQKIEEIIRKLKQ